MRKIISLVLVAVMLMSAMVITPAATDDILDAHEQVRKTENRYDNLVDSCTLIKSIGRDAFMVEGNRGNIKVTTPEDVYMYRALLQYKENEQAFGIGLTPNNLLNN